MFFDEITKRLGADIQTLKNFSWTNIGNLGLVLNGQNTILSYNTCKIVLRCNRQQVFIYGQNLRIQSMSPTDFCVVGQIFCVSDREVSL